MSETANFLIDVTRLLSRLMQKRLPTGIDRVSLEYVRHFRGRALALVRYRGRWLVLSPAESQKIFNVLLAPVTNFRWLVRCAVVKALVGICGRSFPGQILLNAGHSGLHEAGYRKQIMRLQLKAVFFLHDLIPITHPEYCRVGEAEKHWHRLDTMLYCAQHLMVNSSVTMASLEKYAKLRNWSLPPCTVVSLAASMPRPANRRLISEPYFIVLGTIEPRKNHLLLLHLWRQLVDELGNETPRLVIIGQRGWESEQVVDLLERCEALRGVVIERSHCEDAELATWLYYARALLFPSFAEGFGIPLVEALIFQLPVIASNLSIFREIAGDIPEYLDPLDGPGWRRTILDYIQEDSALRNAQQIRMNSYRVPTWDEHFSTVESVLHQLRTN